MTRWDILKKPQDAGYSITRDDGTTQTYGNPATGSSRFHGTAKSTPSDNKNKKELPVYFLTFIRDDMLIVGCDIGSERHYARAIDAKGRELSKGAYSFENNAEGFQSAKDWALHLAAQHCKSQIVLGVEPTGHYWFSLAAWMIANGPSVVQVNPYD